MNAVGWAFVGAGTLSALSLIAILIFERDARRAALEVAEVLGAVFALPWLALLRVAPKRHALSPKALELFARQRRSVVGGDTAAWLFAYRGRGVIVVRPNGPRPGWVNGVDRRGHDAERQYPVRKETP